MLETLSFYTFQQDLHFAHWRLVIEENITISIVSNALNTANFGDNIKFQKQTELLDCFDHRNVFFTFWAPIFESIIPPVFNND